MRGIVAEAGWRETFDRAAALATLRAKWGYEVSLVHSIASSQWYVVRPTGDPLGHGETQEEAVLEALAVPAPPREVDP